MYRFKTISLKIYSAATTLILLLIIGINLINFNYFYYEKIKSINLGLIPGTEDAISFFKTNQIKGPIFNNFSLGGYLTYYFFPNEKVFIDNRPEAYPSAFFTNIYTPMQVDISSWKKYSEEYKINAIFITQLEQTPEFKKFLKNINNDKSWVQVYIDYNVSIYVKNNNQNKEIILRNKNRLNF